jgi:SHS2 domain-containing protein
MAPRSRRWDPARRAEAYAELEHPADLLLEVRGRDLDELFENALFALYDQAVDLTGFRPRRRLTISLRESSLDQALRSMLAEALYRFATERFVATGADVAVSTEANEATAAAQEGDNTGSPQAGTTGGTVRVTAVLHGESADPSRHLLSTEIKAVTYHRLSVEPLGTGPRAAGGPPPAAGAVGAAGPVGPVGWRATVLLDT